ncbi:MAG TPA: sigma-70 family RNA polymerase sigma factor [Polyangia bacterium]|nr:sigma-70 family RNA polymerase sigma factor [Polyangia bacterium]
MDDASRAKVESESRLLCGRGDYTKAATLAIRSYGPEIFGFLLAVHRDRDDASDAFSGFAEALWRGLPSFAWESALRTWAYAIARNVSHQQRRDAGRRAKRMYPGGESALEAVAVAVRTETLGFVRTETRTRLEQLRDGLPPDDQMLLVLRVDRGLSWNELARVLSERGEGGGVDLPKESARLRKRFQLVKDKLHELARREGLIAER